MSLDANPCTCRTCSGPVRYVGPGFRCITGRVLPRDLTPAGLRPGIDCIGVVLVNPTKPRPKVIEKFVCSGCRRAVKVAVAAERPARDCACGGLLVFDRMVSR